MMLYSISVNPLEHTRQFCIGGDGWAVKIFDLRTWSNCSVVEHVSWVAPLSMLQNRQKYWDQMITSAIYSKSGEILASYSNDHIYLFSADACNGIASLYTDPDADDKVSSAIVRRRCDTQFEGGYIDSNDDCQTQIFRDLGASGIQPALLDEDVCMSSSHSLMPKLWKEADGGVLQSFDGHRNVRTIKGVSFLGGDDEWVVSGSDCGYFYIWDAETGNLQACYRGDHDVVNCIEKHPQRLFTLATSGIGDDVKIWEPTAITTKELRDEDRIRCHMNCFEGLL